MSEIDQLDPNGPADERITLRFAQWMAMSQTRSPGDFRMLREPEAVKLLEICRQELGSETEVRRVIRRILDDAMHEIVALKMLYAPSESEST